jgi:DNA polymerase III delta prime subunit
MSKKQLSYTLFTEKFRPENVSGILMPNIYKTFFNKLVEEKEVPSLLLYSSYPGSGKTSLAKALVEDIDADFLYINMSEDSGIDTIRNDARRFASGKSLNKKKKIIICDELDGANINTSQKALRGFLEEFHNNCRIIATCNYVNKIIPALRSRFQEFDFNMNTQEFRKEMIPKVISRICGLMKLERIEFDPEAIKMLVEEKYPDIRKIYNILQQYSKMCGMIDKNILNFVSVDEQLYQLILNKKFTSSRQYILDNGYNFDDLFTDFYTNLVPKVDDKIKQCQMIISIGEWQYKAALSLNKEIAFMAMLVELMEIV